jgi:hypothetical protein
MFSSVARVFTGVAITMVVAVGAIAVGNDRYVDTGDALAQACAGKPATQELENALFNVRARSDGGMDPICAPAVVDDDIDGEGAMLSRAPGSRLHRRHR